MNLSRRGFLEAATIFALSSAATRAQSQPTKVVEITPTIDIAGVENESARRLLKRAFELPGRLFRPILSPTGKQLICGSYVGDIDDVTGRNFKVNSYVLTIASNSQITIRTASKKTPIPGGIANAFSPDGKIFATGSYGGFVKPVDDSIQFWDTKTWRQIGVLRGHPHTVESIVFSPDGKKVISGNYGGGVIVHDVASRTIDKAFQFAGCSQVIGAFWTHEGKYIPLAIVRDISSPWCSHSIFIEGATFAREGVPFGNFDIWNVETNQKIKEVKLPRPYFSFKRELDFSADGRFMALFTMSPDEANDYGMPYYATIIDWTNDRFVEEKISSPSFTTYGAAASLRFLPSQNAALLSDVEADRLATLDVAALAQPQDIAR